MSGFSGMILKPIEKPKVEYAKRSLHSFFQFMNLNPSFSKNLTIDNNNLSSPFG